MRIALPDDSLARRRVFLLAAVAAALCLAAAALLLPASIVRFAAFTLLGLPILFVFFDRPVLFFYTLVLILFSNIDLFTTFRLYRVILSLAVFSLALGVLDGRRLVWHHPVLLALVAAFSVIVLQSISIARNYDAAVDLAGKYFKNLLAIAIVLQFVRTRKEFRIYVFILSVSILLNDLAPLFLTVPAHLGSLSLLWEEGVFRYEGFVLEPNAFAMMQLMLVPMLIYLISLRRRSKGIVALLSLAMLAGVASLVLSFSRGGFLGLAVLLTLVLVLERRNKAVIAVGAILIVSVLILSPGEYWQRVESMLAFARGNRFDFSIYTRLESMKEAFRLGLANPLLGIGVGNFMFASGNMLPFRIIVHNAFLQVFAELGVVGFLLFLAIIAYNFLVIRSLMRRRDPEAALAGRMLLLQLASAIPSAFFIPVAFEYFFWFLLAFPAIADYCFRGEARGSEANPAEARAAGSIPRA